MERTKPQKIARQIVSCLLAMMLIVSLLPYSAFVTNAESATTPNFDGTFESGTLNMTPDGWKIVAHKSWGGSDYYPNSDYPKNYTLYISNDKFVGNKALCLAANDGANKTTFGYVSAQSPAIPVDGDNQYILEYSLKTIVEASETKEFTMGRVYVVEYDANGNQINRTRYGRELAANTDWTSFTYNYTTLENTRSVKLEFHISGKRNYNDGAKLLIDEVSFATLPDDRLLNGGFEETKANGELYSWYLRPCTKLNDDSNSTSAVPNHELKIVDGYHGKAAQITKKGAGYVTLTSNMMKTAANTTYVVDCALKVLNRDQKTFVGANMYIAEFDKDQKLIERIRLQGTADVIDWTEYSSTYTPSENASYFRIELYCGDYNLEHTFTVQFDDVEITSFVRNNAKNNVHNGGFEEVHQGTIFDWTFQKVAGTTYSSTFDGYNGKGLYIKRRSDAAGHGTFKSNIFEVKPGQQFKATYMIRLDNKVGTVYALLSAVFYDKDGKEIDKQRVNEADYRLNSLEWSRTQSVFNVPDGAVSCQLSFRVNGTSYDCYIDDVEITYTNPTETNYGFNKLDSNGEMLGWTVSYPDKAKLDTSVYREGTGSLFISQYVDNQKTYVYCDTLIPVESGLRYELIAYVKSYGCDISADGMIMNARCYDADGKYLGVNSIIGGRHIVLSSASTPSEWREMICGLTLPKNAAYIRPVIEIPNGEINLWIDDLQCIPYSLQNEFYEDFNSVTNSGNPAGWTQTVEDGEPEFNTNNSVVTITAEDSDDIGVISSRWETRMEYTNMKYTMVYATEGDTGAKVTIKFYGFNDKEIEADRIVKEFDSTDGEYQKVEFDFMLLSAKYMRIEISNTEDGVLHVEDLSIVSFEDESSDEEEIGWRGYWVWHDENYKDSINGTSRYFRYHFTLDEIPVSSVLQITADDRLKVYVNGVQYEEDNMKKRFTEVSYLDNIHESLQIGDNVIAVEVWNYTAYAGLLFDGFAEYESGERVDIISTTAGVISTKVLEEGWQERTFDDSKWTHVMFMDYNAGGTWPEDLTYEKAPFIKDKFEVVEHTLSDSIIAGEDAVLTMTVIPEVDFTKDIDLVGKLWIRNSQNMVMSVNMVQTAGPKMSEWRKGEQVTVSFSFNIPDFIASGRYNIQLDTNQVVITNYDIFNNKFVKAINVTNNTANQQMKAEMVDVNGTYAISINGDIYPFQIYNKPNSEPADNSNTTHYMHEAGICITYNKISIGANTSASYHEIWNGIDDYNWSVLDKEIYEELALHPDTYLMPSLYLSVRDWWCEQHPEQLVVDSKGGVHDLSMFAESAMQVSLKANVDMIEHMMSQPYWNRIIGFVLNGFGTSEWMWDAKTPTYTIDYSEAATTYFREWLTKKYGTDAELQKAWNNKTVTLKTAVNPPYEEHQNEKYDSIYDPEVNRASLDYIQCQEEREIELVSRFHNAIAEAVNDTRIQGSYFGYLYTRGFYENANRSMNSRVEQIMDNPNIDFMAAPATYSERFDGEAAAMCQMIDGVLKKGKAVMIEDDYRACAYINLAKNFYTRDSVGTTYNMSDSISAFLKVQAASLTQGAAHWYFDIEGMMFEREQFSRIFEVIQAEKYIDLSREKSYTGEVVYIMDEDGYEYNSTGKDGKSIYDATYELIFEQKYDLAKAGIMTDYYSMSDLVNGIVPDYKVYVMINTVEIDAEEKAAIEKHLKNKGKIVLWQWLAGASDGNKIDAKNMSDLIGMDVKFDTSELVLKSIISNKEHWLIEGVEGKTMGSGLGYRVASPVAYVTDNDANIAKLGTMYEHPNYTSLAVLEDENWTSIFSSVPGYNVYMIKNILKHAGVHIYSENPDDIIYANSNYVAINAAYGGEKSLKLDGTYAVYDVVGQTTYSTSTDVINFTMDDNSTKIFRLMPVNTNIIYIHTNYKGTADTPLYNEVITGEDFECEITADEGYVISQIITDTERKTINRSSYTVEFDDVDNSHFVRVLYARAGDVETESNVWIYVLIGAGVLLVAAAAVFFIIFLKRKKEKEAEDAE